MSDTPETKKQSRHLRMVAPSAWFQRFEPMLPRASDVLDLAAGGGRHVRFFADQGHHVTAVDKNAEPLLPFSESHGAEVIEADLEDGSPWPLAERTFDAVVICNYLYRPGLADVMNAIGPGGFLFYETFARGNEVFNRPRNPDHLLKSGELLELVSGRLQIIAYQHGIIEGDECPGVKQMIVAQNNLDQSERDDGEPVPLAIPLT